MLLSPPKDSSDIPRPFDEMSARTTRHHRLPTRLLEPALANEHIYGNVHYTKRPLKKDGVGGKLNSSATAGVLALSRHLPNIHRPPGRYVGRVARSCASPARAEICHG